MARYWPLPASFLNDCGVSTENACLVRVCGDSMADTVKDGAWLLVDQSAREVREEGIYVIRIEDALLARRLQRMANGSILMKCDNPAYDSDRVPVEQVPALFVLGSALACIGRL